MVPVVCLSAGALAVFLLAVKATSKYCDDGHICSPPRECCASGCCHAYGPPGGIPPPQVPAPPPASLSPPPSIPTIGDRQHILTVISWNHWYFWFLLLFLLVSCLLGGCGWLRRRRLSECRCCCCCCCCFGCPPSCRMDSRASDTEDDEDDDEEEGEGGWGSEGGRGTPSRTYGPRCVPYHSPPPYSEVTSKPDLYPLVISVGGGNGCGAKSPVSMSGSNNGAGGYLMVHFFRNYFVRPVGSLSATSTVDSLSSSFLCSAANEANTLIPPPYCEEEDEEVADERTEADEEVEEDDDGDRGRVEEDVTDDDNHMASRSLSGRRGRFRRNLIDEQATDVSDSQAPPSPSGASWSQAEDLRLAFSGSEVSSLGLGTPCSPPRATTPTPGLSNPTAQPSEELRDLLDKIQRLPGAGGSSSGSGREGEVHGKRRTSTGGRRDGRVTGQRRGSGWLLLGPSGGKVVGGAGTRSAPTTPSTHFAPGLFRPASVTRGPATDGGSPLLSRNDSGSSTHEEEGAVPEEEEEQEQDDVTSPSS